MEKALEHRSTREAILDAGERLFAAEGIEGASLRAITAEAGVNLAAVNYHFGGKEKLVREVFTRRTAPANAERLRRLEEVMSSDSPHIEGVLKAFILPVVEAVHDPSRAHFVQLVARAHSEPSPLVRSIMKDEFEDVFRRFLEAMATICPEMSRSDLVWRFQFTLGAMVQMICSPALSRILSEAGIHPEAEEVASRLTAFVTGGFEAKSRFDR